MFIPYALVEDPEEAFTILQTSITADKLLEFNIHATLDFYAGDYSLSARGDGFSLKLYCEDEGVKMDLDLSFFLLPFRSKIERKLEEILRAHL